VGGCTSCRTQFTHSLKPPAFNPCTYEVKNRHFAIHIFRFNLYR
jgi:acetoacetate decarboxylase